MMYGNKKEYIHEYVDLHNMQQTTIYTGRIKSFLHSTQQIHHYYPYNYMEH